MRTQNQIQSNLDEQLTGSETGLVGYWTFDEPSGSVAIDSSTQSNNGSLGGGVASQMPTRVVRYTTSEDAPLSIGAANGVLANDVDVDNNP